MPSYTQGYAHSSCESAYPDLWRGLIGAWVPAFGPTGSRLFDVSGHGKDAVIPNVSPATYWQLGQDGNSLFLARASSTYLPTGIFLGAVNEFSIVVFGFVGWDAGLEYIADTSDGATGLGWRVSAANTQDFWCYRPAGISFAGSLPFINDEYAHRVAVMESSRIVLYRNGVEIGSNSDQVGLLVSSPSSINIGAEYTGTNLPDTRLNAAMVYNRALTPSEVMQLYVDPLAPFRMRDSIAFVPAAAAGKMLMRYPGMTGGMQQLTGGAAA